MMMWNRSLPASAVLLMVIGCTGRTPKPEVPDAAIKQQAARCGLKPDQLLWRKDAEAHREALITPNGNLDSLPFNSLGCMLKWARETGANVGFVSEPPRE
jgi:hypothetical protein